MATCEKCAGTLTQNKRDQYSTDMFGIPVTLINAVTEESCTVCGEVNVCIPDHKGLIAALAIARAMEAPKLSGKDIRFMRKALEVPAKTLAEMLEVTVETVSRWENEKLPIGATSEKLLRMVVGIVLEESAPGVVFDRKHVLKMRILSAHDHKKRAPLVFIRGKVRQQQKLEDAYVEAEAA